MSHLRLILVNIFLMVLCPEIASHRVRPKSSANAMAVAMAVVASNADQSEPIGCSSAAAHDWRKHGYEMVNDKKNGHGYLSCISKPDEQHKISCMKEDCGDRAEPGYNWETTGWCFVPKHCGGAWTTKSWITPCKRLKENLPTCSASITRHNRRLELRVNGAMLSRNLDLFTDMDPYVDIRLGTKQLQTSILIGGGLHPHGDSSKRSSGKASPL